jgi:hypothetical protein
MMPVNQLVAIIRRTPPRNAVSLLRELPDDRLNAAIEMMGAADLVRILPAAGPDFRETVVQVLSDERLVSLFRAPAAEQPVDLLWVLPRQRLSTVVDGLPDAIVEDLLARLPGDKPAALLAVMAPPRGRHMQARKYEHDVAGALARANLDVAAMESGIVLVRGLERRIVVAARYGDDGRIAVRDVEAEAYRMRANAALAVCDHQPAGEIVRYCEEARQSGRRLDAVAWADHQDDGLLMRTLVSLFR